MFNRQSAIPSYQQNSGYFVQLRCITMPHFQLLKRLLIIFQAKNSEKSPSPSFELKKLCMYCKSSPTWQWRKEWSTKESKVKLWQNHDASIGAAAVSKKARLGMKQHLLVKKSILQTQLLLSYTCLKALLIQSVSWSVGQSVGQSVSQQKFLLNNKFQNMLYQLSGRVYGSYGDILGLAIPNQSCLDVTK